MACEYAKRTDHGWECTNAKAPCRYPIPDRSLCSKEGVTSDYATYRYLRDAKGMPCGDQKYYRTRRKFYWLLDKKI